MLLAMVVGIWVARYLGPAKFGIYNYVLALVSIYLTVAKLGLDGVVTRELIQESSNCDEILSTAFWLKFTASAASYTLLLSTLFFMKDDQQTENYLLVAGLSIFFHSSEVIEFLFQSRVNSKVVSLCKILQITASSCFKGAIILYELNFNYFFILFIIDQLFLAGAYQVSFKLHFSRKFDFKRFRFDTAKRLLSDSWPLLIASFAMIIQARFDQVLLKELISPKELGLYSVPLRLIEAFCFLPMILSQSFLPALTNAKKTSQEKYEKRLLNLYRLFALCLLPLIVSILIGGGELISLLFGSNYADSVVLFKLMTIRLFIAFFGIARSLFLLIENLTFYSMISSYIGAGLNIFLNFLLIKKYGALGAIISGAISFFVTAFVIDLFYPRTKKNVLMIFKSILSFYKLSIRELI